MPWFATTCRKGGHHNLHGQSFLSSRVDGCHDEIGRFAQQRTLLGSKGTLCKFGLFMASIAFLLLNGIIHGSMAELVDALFVEILNATGCRRGSTPATVSGR